MKFSYFDVTNFKGINNIRLDFDAKPKSGVYALVGLNESGKTTILEALNFLSYKPEDLNALNLPGYSIKDVHDLIPINKRANFNDPVIIKAGFRLDETDREQLFDRVSKLELFRNHRETKDFSELHIVQTYLFTNSKLHNEGQPISTLSIGKDKKTLVGDQGATLFKQISDLFPSVLYFPNFLFEFPDTIYLEESPIDEEKHQFYRLVLQDVLDSIGDNMNLKDHILDRAKDGSTNAKNMLEATLLQISEDISGTVFRNWNKMFNTSPRNSEQEIVINCEQDQSDRWFLRLRLKDRGAIYSISERSLGFRWFFAFLLLTQYRGFRREGPKNVLFLFDEPASNLHSSAQSQLLESFGKLGSNCTTVYTTHSHHMINPSWLDGTYVVKNERIDYKLDSSSYNKKATRISLEKYREFAVRNPNQTTYFQPILDVLNYTPSKLENIPNIVMLEGKNDFYTLKYFQEKLLNIGELPSLLPGTGAGSLDDIIRLYIAWGREFILLLDSDKEGRGQKKRYENLFGTLVFDRIFTLSDIDPDWKHKEMEDLILGNDRLKIQATAYPEATEYDKSHFNRAVQELFLTNKRIKLSQETMDNFGKVVKFCSERLSSWVSRDQ
ncbi:MAG TPA: AAA family ATPase [Blastocatellia bacterium]|nr:AAA family ATPase [Blastocatellia bacterium]HMZ21502.1 AAA family ATPase [Blastocatellia bacterium]